MENLDKYTFQTSDNQKVEVSQQEMEFFKSLNDRNIDEDIPLATIDSITINIILKYIRDHNFDSKEMKTNQPLKSRELKSEIDAKSYELLKDYQGLDNMEKIQPLVQAAYFLNFTEFQDTCLAVLGIEFYIGNTEIDLDKFRVQNDIPDLTPEEEAQIQQQYASVFEKINQEFKKAMIAEIEKEQNAEKQKEQTWNDI